MTDYVIRDGQSTPQQQTFGAFTLNGVNFPKHALVDPTTGAAIGVSGAPMPITASALPLPAGAALDSSSQSMLAQLQALVAAAQSAAATAVDTVVKATSVSRSGTIATGGTAQQLMAANANRRGFVLQNQSSGDLYINGLATATADNNSLKIGAGGYYETPVHHVGTGAISIIGATAGAAYFCREF